MVDNHKWGLLAMVGLLTFPTVFLLNEKDGHSAGKCQWNYNKTSLYGPSHWKDCYHSCNGTRQSPIDIDTGKLTPLHIPELIFTNFDNELDDIIIENNGHTVDINLTQSQIDSSNVPRLSGGALNGTYELTQFHYHWSENDTFGSEHTVDGKHFPLEQHMVLKRTDVTNDKVLTTPNSLAVLSVLFVIGQDPSPLRHITSELNNIKKPGDKTSIESFKLKEMLPSDKSQFYRYNGSLTTPSCAQVVIWTVFEQPLSVTEEQMKLFRKVKNSNYEPVDNFRPEQGMDGRVVYQRDFS